jgi:hypothetical protein
MSDDLLRIVSLGAGVQSTTLVLMAAAGEITPMPHHAIFADTGSEPAAVYAHLEWLRSPGVLPFPVHVVNSAVNGQPQRSLRDELLAFARGTPSKRGSHARPPLFVKNPDGSKGMIRRQCTEDYKIRPIERKVRELLGVKPRSPWPTTVRVEQWIGISRDEVTRMKASRRACIVNRHPLIDLGMTRRGCYDWLEAHGYTIPPKSACTFCPFHDDQAWRQLKDTDPAGWADAVAVDEAIRHGFKRAKMHGEFFVHGQLIPLVDVDLTTLADHGQQHLWDNECEGHCGV